MRFVFLTLGYHPDKPGGAYRYVAEVAERLAQSGAEVYAIYPGESRRCEDEERVGVNLRRFPDAHGFFAANWFSENRLAGKRVREITNRPQKTLFVVCHAFFGRSAASLGSRYASLFTGPWGQEFLFSRGGGTDRTFKRALEKLIAHRMAFVERRTLQQSAIILTISNYYVHELPRWHAPIVPPVRMISGGVNLQRFCPPSNRQAVRAKWGLSPRDFLLLSVRRLDPRMGLAMLVRAFRQVPDKTGAQLWIAGTGSQHDALVRLIHETQQQERIRLLGFVPENQLTELYGVADCTIAPSLALEGFGLVLVESLACGTPALGADSGAISEVLKPLDPALLFLSNSEAELASVLIDRLSNRLKLPSRESCRRYSELHFSWDRPVRGFQTAFEEVATG